LHRPTDDIEDAGPEGQQLLSGDARALVVMGVAGAGKTTVARLTAARLGWTFIDADDFHPSTNRAKMSAGIGLTEDDRAPWLRNLRAALASVLEQGESVVAACSALHRRHREILGAADPRVRFVWLNVSPDTLRRRLASRGEHFAGVALLRSQLDELEPPTPGEAHVVDAEAAVETIVPQIVRLAGS